ncbi:MAG TPA: methyl-accepting chemotaxis protein [Myxococcales bacterium]|jgi:conjugal transfer/entry exclusion protein
MQPLTFEQDRRVELAAIQRRVWRIVLFGVLPVVVAFNVLATLGAPCWQAWLLLGASVAMLGTWAAIYFRTRGESMPLAPVVGSAIAFSILSMLLRQGAVSTTGISLLSIASSMSLFSERALARSLWASGVLFGAGLAVGHFGLIPQIPQSPERILVQTLVYAALFFVATYYVLRTGQRISASLYERTQRGGRRNEEVLEAVGGANPELHSAIASLGPIAEDFARMASEQAGASAEMGTSAEHVLKMVGETVAAAQETRALSQRIRDDAEQGRQKLRAVEKAFQGAVGRIEAVRAQNEELAQEVARTEEINAAIQDIADSLSMMGINASLEAARAGEHGRGFAVVAVELQRMVGQTTTDLGRAAKLLEHLRHRAGVMGEENLASTVALRSSFEELVAVAGLLDGITGSFQQASQSVEQIASAAQAQRTGISQIAEGVRAVAQSAAGLSSSGDGMREGLSRVETAHRKLQGVLERRSAAQAP